MAEQRELFKKSRVKAPPAKKPAAPPRARKARKPRPTEATEPARPPEPALPTPPPPEPLPELGAPAVTVLDVLERMRARIAHPGRYSEPNTALDLDGRPVPPDDPRAVRWSVAGARDAETEPGSRLARAVTIALDRARAELDPPRSLALASFTVWLRGRPHADALRLLERAKESAQ